MGRSTPSTPITISLRGLLNEDETDPMEASQGLLSVYDVSCHLGFLICTANEDLPCQRGLGFALRNLNLVFVSEVWDGISHFPLIIARVLLCKGLSDICTMLVAGLALGIALLVPFFYLLQRSPALQPRPLPHVQGGSSTSCPRFRYFMSRWILLWNVCFCKDDMNL